MRSWEAVIPFPTYTIVTYYSGGGGEWSLESGRSVVWSMAIAARSSYILDLVCMLIHLGTWR